MQLRDVSKAAIVKNGGDFFLQSSVEIRIKVLHEFRGEPGR